MPGMADNAPPAVTANLSMQGASEQEPTGRLAHRSCMSCRLPLVIRPFAHTYLSSRTGGRRMDALTGQWRLNTLRLQVRHGEDLLFPAVTTISHLKTSCQCTLRVISAPPPLGGSSILKRGTMGGFSCSLVSVTALLTGTEEQREGNLTYTKLATAEARSCTWPGLRHTGHVESIGTWEFY